MKHTFVTTLAAALLASSANAAGFAIKNEAPTYLGQSYAGVSAASDDIATQFYNGALIAQYNANHISGGSSVLLPAIEAKNFSANSSAGLPVSGRSSRGNAVQNVAIPNLSAVLPLDSRWTAGLALTSPWGLATNYDDDWKGRYYGISTRLSTINSTPTLAYSVTDSLAISAGAQVQYAKGRLTNAVDCGLINAAFGLGLGGYVPGSSANDCHGDLQGSDWGYGYTGGLLYKPDMRTRIGLSYRSEIDHELKGDVKYNNPNPIFAAVGLRNGDASLHVKTPAVATFGVQHDLTPEWTLGMEAQWTQWGSTEEFRARFTSGQADNVIDADWSDAWFYSLGGSYRPDQGRAIYRFGAGFDQSPVSNRTREVRVPDSNRYWLSAGAGYELTSNVRLDATYLAMQFDDGRISQNASGNNALRGTLNGEFNSFLNIISLQLSSKF